MKVFGDKFSPLPHAHVQKWGDVNRRISVANDLVRQRRPLVLSVVHVFALNLFRRLARVVLRLVRLQLHLLLGSHDGLDAGAGASVDDVVPVSAASGRKLHVPLDEEDAGVADLAAAFLVEAEAFLEERLVPFAVGETGAEKDGINILMKYCIYISIGKLMSHV